MALLHGAAEGNALFQLLGNVLGDQLGVGVGLLDLHDVAGLTALPVNASISFLSASAPAPPRPMTMPGLAVKMFTRDLVGSALNIDVGDAGADRAFP